MRIRRRILRPVKPWFWYAVAFGMWALQTCSNEEPRSFNCQGFSYHSEVWADRGLLNEIGGKAFGPLKLGRLDAGLMNWTTILN